MTRCVCCLLPWFVFAPAAWADVLHVPADFATIQAAIDAAQDGDEIVLAEGEYADVGLTLDRPIGLAIRSQDPDSSSVVAGTVLEQAVTASLLDIDASGGHATVALRGLGIRFVSDQNVVVGIGADLDFDRCMIAPLTDDAASDGLLSLATAPGGRLVSASVAGSTLTGRLGVSGARYIDVTQTVVADAEVAFRADVISIVGCEWTDAGLDIRTFGNQQSDNEDAGPITVLDSRFERCTNDNAFAAVDASGRLTMINSVVADCGPEEPAGILFNGLGVDATDCTFVGNRAAVVLHAFSETGGRRTEIRRCVFEDNTLQFIRNSFNSSSSSLDVHEDALVVDCIFSGNTMPDGTNGSPCISWWLDETVINPRLELLRTRFVNNTTTASASETTSNSASVVWRDLSLPSLGGRIVLSAKDCWFGGNAVADPADSLPSFGHAALFSGFSADGRMAAENWLSFRNSVFVANRSTRTALHYGRASYDNCTIVGNTGTLASLGVGGATLRNTIFVPADPDLQPCVTAFDLEEVAPTVSNSIIPVAMSGTDSTSLDPLFIRNPSDGGDGWGDDPSTPDIDESLNDDFGDLRLRQGSPGIDAGRTRPIHYLPIADLDGNPRLADDPGIPGNAIDIGAYEFQGTTCLADVNSDGFATPADFNAWIFVYNGGRSLADQNRDGEVTPADFNAWISNFNAGC